jgi:putative transposase
MAAVTEASEKLGTKAACEEWYNHDHHHLGLGLVRPADVYFGRVQEKLAARALVLRTAFAARPERFTRGLPVPAAPAMAVWINQPVPQIVEENR